MIFARAVLWNRALAAACGLLVASCGHAPQTAKPVYGAWGFDAAGEDRATKPGDDFFRFANGAWLDRMPIPADKTVVSLRQMMSDRTEAQLHDMIEQAAAKAPHHPADLEDKMGAFYKSFMDEGRVEQLGAKPIAPELDDVRATRTRDELAALCGRNESDYEGSLFTFFVDADLKDPDHYAVYLSQSGLGLPDRDYYLKPEFGAQKGKYQEYAAQLLHLIDWPAADARAKDVVEFETKIAVASWTKAQQRDVVAEYNPVPVAELGKFAPGFAWSGFLIPIALTLAALSTVRSKSDLKDLWGRARVWVMLLVVAAGVRVLVDAIVPFDVERYFLAQVRPGFSEMEFSRRFLFGGAIALILAAAGFHGAWKTSRVRSGILTSIASALTVAFPLFAFAALVDRSSIPYQILLATSAIASVLGTIGAMLGRGLRGAPVKRLLGVAAPLLIFLLFGCSNTEPLETAKTLAALHYDASKSISIEGPISLIHFPPQGPGIILVKGKDRGYAFLMAETKAMAKAGFNRFSVGPGMSVRITGLLPADGRTIDWVIAVQATTVKTLDGRTLFDRSALAD